MKRYLIFMLLFLASAHSIAQSSADSLEFIKPGVLDGVYIKNHKPPRIITCGSYPYSDSYSPVKTVWLNIDSSHALFTANIVPKDSAHYNVKSNLKWTFWEILKAEIYNGNLQLYSPYNPLVHTIIDGDVFKYPINSILSYNCLIDSLFHNELRPYFTKPQALLNQIEIRSQVGDSPLLEADVITRSNSYTSQDIVVYRLKEEWYFDRCRNVLDRRIVGIAPIVQTFDLNGELVGTRALFWLYFSSCQNVFEANLVYNRRSNSTSVSLLDVFNNRMFEGYIIKESNTCSIRRDEFTKAIDASLNFQLIHNKLSQLERALWVY